MTPTQSQMPEGFVFPIRVYWEDTDAGGIVFYANYLKFFERARTEWLRSLGLHQSELKERTGGMFVVTDTQVQYRHPARLDDELLVTAHLQELGRASVTIGQQARLKGAASGTLNVVCTGQIRIGWVNASTLRPARIPADIMEALK